MTTFTGTGEPSNTPPRIRLDVDAVLSGATFNTLSITRNGVPIRSQPPTGTQTTTAYDYEMPFGESVQYAASGTYLPYVAPDWTETWPNLSAWTGDTGSWAVGSGAATSSVYAATINRSASGSIQRVSVTSPSNVHVRLLSASDAQVAVIASGAASTTLTTSAGSSVVPDTGSYSVSLLDGEVTVTAADASWSLSGSYTGTPTKVALVSQGGTYVESGTAYSVAGDPDRIVVAASGNIYTLDVVGKLVRKYNSSHVFQTSWSTTNTPNDIALDSAENVYVTDIHPSTWSASTRRRAQRVSPGRRPACRWASASTHQTTSTSMTSPRHDPQVHEHWHGGHVVGQHGHRSTTIATTSASRCPGRLSTRSLTTRISSRRLAVDLRLDGDVADATSSSTTGTRTSPSTRPATCG